MTQAAEVQTVEIVLASASATRIRLLRDAGLSFVTLPASIDERTVEAPLITAGVPAGTIAEALAEEKAIAVSKSHPDALVIGADQTLDLFGRRWTKPADLSEARTQLTRLSGRAHRLHTAVATARAGTVVWRHLETAHLTMRRLTNRDIEAYLARVGDAALASVGAYQIEGPAIQLFDEITGDYFAILGLPLLPLLRFLRREGAIA